ncbi:MAG TPA: AMP-binding protein [Coxiellaceae bacterium]|nr:MAG: long-chain-fatty-acid--CoA ligase [Gammaproteobacteria bacterium RIFCSPHIGHO2_12_FULL_36_30]HLB57109.1 AMP-binding protein [Coxiellaceae bacterium]
MTNKVWFQHYTKGVPETINPDQFTSLVDLFEKYEKDFSDRPAFTNFGVTIAYHEMKILIRDFAAFLQHDLKLKKGDRIAMMMPNVLQYPIAIFGALKAGLIVTNINPLYTAPELASQVNDSGAETIIVLENFADHLESALPKIKIKNIIITKIGDLLGSLKGAFFNFAVKYCQKKIPQYYLPRALFFKNCLARGKKLSFDLVEMQNTDLAFLQYTGGTTGVSKGAMLSHRNIIANVLQCAVWIHDVEAQNHGVLIGALPLYHIFSLTVCGMCIFPMGASSVLITNPRDMKSFVKAIKHCGMTMMIGLNTLFNGLLNNADFKNVDFSKLALTISGGMAMQKAVADRWQKVTGNAVLEGYGLTETSPVITLCPVSNKSFTGSVGLPVSSTDITIRDENNHDVSFKETGEICAKGPQVMSGYWHQPIETKNAIDEEGWFHTGDIGYMDEDGFVYIVDRKKDMVLVSGFNVYPNEVEAVLASHPGVLSVAVIGIPSEKTGEALKAFVVKKDPALTEQELIAFSRNSLTAYKVPHLVEFRDALPLSTVGKILRRELRDEEVRKSRIGI